MADTAQVRFSEAIEFFRRVLAIGAEEWLELLAEEGATSTAIADDTVRSMIGDLVGAIAEIVAEGGTLADFRERYDEIVAANGWSYHGNAGWHTTLLFRLWTGMAYAAGRWEQALRLEEQRPGTVFARLVTAADARVRHSHAEMHGIILPIGHPYWMTHWPPNGFNCRCHVMIVSERDLARYGWEVTEEEDSRLLVEPDEGWAFNPGRTGSPALSSRRRAADIH